MNGRHKVALIFAGYRWVEDESGSDYRYEDSGGVPIGFASQGLLGWWVNLYGRWSGTDWPDRSGHYLSGQTRYPTRKAAQRALEEIAYGLFAAGFKL
jgi:hypothetical protein